MVKTRPQLLVALALVVPLAATPATRAFADPLEDCQHVYIETSVRTGYGPPGARYCPPISPR